LPHLWHEKKSTTLLAKFFKISYNKLCHTCGKQGVKMPLTIELTDEEKAWPANSTEIITKIMQSILSREFQVSVLPPIEDKDQSFFAKYDKLFKKEKKSGFYQIIGDDDHLSPVFTTSSNLLDAEVEFFWTIGLRADLRIAFIDLVAVGDDVGAKIGPREALRGFGYYKAKQAVFVHNHPSGKLEFSIDDLQMTKTLMRAGWLLNCELRDHIIMNSKFEVASLLEAKQMSSLHQLASFEEMSANKVAAEAMQEITKRDRVIRKHEDELDKKVRIINIQSNENKELHKETKEQGKKITRLEDENAILKAELESLKKKKIA
jgi:hypothetical protein